MLTFKKTFEDAKTVFQDAVDQRETFIHNLLAVFQADRLRPVGLITALNNLATAQDDFDAAEKEMLRLEHIEHVTDEIVDPFPPRIAEKLRSIGIDAAAQRELANEMLADANGGPEAMRALHENARLADKPADDRVRRWLEGDWTIDEPAEMPDAPWRTADIGGGTVEFAPWVDNADLRRDFAHARSAMERGTTMHKILEGDWAIQDDPAQRPSLHSDGHVGPVAEHCAICGGALDDDAAFVPLHDILEALTQPVVECCCGKGNNTPTGKPWYCTKHGKWSDEPLPRKSKTDTMIDEMRAEVEAAWRKDDE
jgi:hypothetical protein